jgi:hypothetical protein
MGDASITYFPVGNGDTSLVKLTDAATIVIDINVREKEADGWYDVHTHLLGEMRKDDDGFPHLDVFVLTHPDQDHSRGFSSVFFQGSPDDYKEKDKKDGRIIIDELWFSPRIFSPHEKKLCDEAKEFRKEAQRRIDLYKKGGAAPDKPGNRIRIIGFTDNPELAGLAPIVTVPGNQIHVINGSTKNDLSIFVHAPTKKETDSKWAERNDTSIVMQFRFKVGDVNRAALAFFGGDAGCAIWLDIISKSSVPDLEFDLFMAPHHCSWTFFSEEPSEEENPDGDILNFLEKRKREGAFAIASSKPIKDDDDNPPHYIAAEKYKEIFGTEKFLCTGEHPSEKSPEPIFFTMTKKGPVKDDPGNKGQIKSSAAVTTVVSSPRTYGRRTR